MISDEALDQPRAASVCTSCSTITGGRGGGDSHMSGRGVSPPTKCVLVAFGVMGSTLATLRPTGEELVLLVLVRAGLACDRPLVLGVSAIIAPTQCMRGRHPGNVAARRHTSALGMILKSHR